jgi:hypothetical protein
VSQRDQIRRNEEYQDARPQPLTVTITTEPRPISTDHVVRLLEQIGWRGAAWMVKVNAEEAAERHRTVRKLLETIGRLERRIAELDPPIPDGMRYTGD